MVGQLAATSVGMRERMTAVGSAEALAGMWAAQKAERSAAKWVDRWVALTVERKAGMTVEQ